jgi:gluconokinase
MMIWSDGRSSAQAENLIKANGKEIFLKTGTPIHPMTPFVKLLWMKETNDKAYHNASYFMTMKEFLLQKWFGARVIDYSMASSTGLLNVKALDWDDEVLALAGITREQLSDIVPPTKVLNNIRQDIAAEIGIAPDLPFVIGAADGQLENLGNGYISPGEVNVSMGTSGAIRQFAKGAPVDENLATFTYAFTDDMSIVGGPTNNGGIVLQWLKDLLEFTGTHNEFVAGADQVEAGADGLIFHPYINGERAPLWNQRARGNFFGLNISHRRPQLVRALLEGITFNIYQIGKSLENVAGKPEKISVNGGLAKSALWVQIMADVFGKEIHLSDTHHNAAWGAAWTALVGTGAAASFLDIKENMPEEKVIAPNMENHKKYAEVYKKYEEIGKDITNYFTGDV